MNKFWNLTFKKMKGFSLMELMISVGLVGVLSVGVTTVMKQQTIQTKKSEAAVDTGGITNLVSFALNNINGTVCRDALTQNAAGVQRQADANISININDAQAAGIIPADQSNQNIVFRSLNLFNRREEGRVDGVLSAQQKIVYSYSASITFDLTSAIMQQNGGVTTVTRQLPYPILVEADQAQNILDCVDTPQYISDESQEDFCAAAGGDLDTSGINNNPSVINCVFNSRADGANEIRTITGLPLLIQTANNWAGFAPSAQRLVVRQGLSENTNDLAPLTQLSQGSGGIDKPNRITEPVNGSLTVTGADVTVDYTNNNDSNFANDEMTNSTQSAVNGNFALSNCWMTNQPCGSSSAGTSPTSSDSSNGAASLIGCSGSSGLSADTCSTTIDCPDGYYPVAVSAGTTSGTSSPTSSQQMSAPKGSFTCQPLVENSECPRGQATELIASPDGSGSIRVECGPASPPPIAQYQCNAMGNWVATGVSGPPACLGVTNGCSSSSSASSNGDLTCCNNSPAGPCNSSTCSESSRYQVRVANIGGASASCSDTTDPDTIVNNIYLTSDYVTNSYVVGGARPIEWTQLPNGISPNSDCGTAYAANTGAPTFQSGSYVVYQADLNNRPSSSSKAILTIANDGTYNVVRCGPVPVMCNNGDPCTNASQCGGAPNICSGGGTPQFAYARSRLYANAPGSNTSGGRDWIICLDPHQFVPGADLATALSNLGASATSGHETLAQNVMLVAGVPLSPSPEAAAISGYTGTCSSGVPMGYNPVSGSSYIPSEDSVTVISNGGGNAGVGIPAGYTLSGHGYIAGPTTTGGSGSCMCSGGPPPSSSSSCTTDGTLCAVGGGASGVGSCSSCCNAPTMGSQMRMVCTSGANNGIDFLTCGPSPGAYCASHAPAACGSTNCADY